MANSAAPELALGVISAPGLMERRDLIRQTWFANLLPWVVAKFVVRTGQCSNGGGRRLSTTVAKATNASSLAALLEMERRASSDMLSIDSVCADEKRRRGAVLTIFAWLQHAVATYPTATFIARTDDDVWLDLLSLRFYLDAVRAGAAERRTRFAFVGNLLYSNYIQNGTVEYDTGFGYTCGMAKGSFDRLVQAGVTNGNQSLGPFVFAPGFLNILSQPLAASLAGSSALQQNIEQVRTAPNGVFGLEDKWLGSAMQRHVDMQQEGLLAVHMDLGSKLAFDGPGVHIYASTILWHNNRKVNNRIRLVDAFSRKHGCLTAHVNRTLPQLKCEPMKGPCAPHKSQLCRLTPLCEPRHYRINNSNTSAWIACPDTHLFQPC